MQIKNFKFDDKRRDWCIEETGFDNFNLLVGISGVGKTRILKAIQNVCQVATGSYQPFGGMEWKIGFVHANQEYEWELKNSLVPNFSEVDESEPAAIIYEKIFKKAGDQKMVLLERSETTNQLGGKEIPKLKKTESAISLLSEEISIAPIYEGFKSVIFNETLPTIPVVTSRIDPESIHRKSLMPLDVFKQKSIRLPTVIKAYRLAKFYPQEFNQLKVDFTNIFTSVEDLKVIVARNKEIEYEFSFNIKESGEWISQARMSSGMFRILVQLIDISLAPPGSVILIDEFENSLGINCMPEMTDFVMSKAPLMQFILSSHHPYIISKIPQKTWKLVSRKGGHVIVKNATDIPQLQTASRLNKFIQLANLPEYEEGIL
ncbi:MAG: ATP-binding protein [Pseudomonadota bacterium]